MNMRKRHRVISTLKACTWRVLASADTFLIGFLLTGSAAVGASIASIEVLTKMFSEETEQLEEANAVEYARKLASYAVKRGGIDKKDFMKI